VQETPQREIEPWSLSIPRDGKAKRRLVGRFAILYLIFSDYPSILLLTLARALSPSTPWLPIRAIRIPAPRAWNWIENGSPLTIDKVLWTREGLTAELATVELRHGQAFLRDRSTQSWVDLSTFEVVQLLPAEQAPPQCHSKSDERWVRLHSAASDRLLRTDERQLSLIGRCAGWTDPRTVATPAD
jgi:hypothetical protein